MAAETADPRVRAIAARAAEPLRVAVCGRRGVGRGTVANALACAGVTTTAPRTAEVVVYVLAEVVKPEDAEYLADVSADRTPVLAVLNKVDLAGGIGCARVSALTGAPAEPLVGLLALAALDDRLDDALWAALGALAAERANLGCADDFVSCPHRAPPAVRQRLCDTLGLFGVARAIAALRQGSPAAAVQTLLRRLSGVDVVVARIAAVGAEVSYRRMLDAVARLETLAIGDGRIGEFLSGDDVAFARMSAAVAVLAAAGLDVDSGDADPSDADPSEEGAAQLRRAVAWQRYGRGPVSAVHRACADDIARASLRRWSAAGGAR